MASASAAGGTRWGAPASDLHIVSRLPETRNWKSVTNELVSVSKFTVGTPVSKENGRDKGGGKLGVQ